MHDGGVSRFLDHVAPTPPRVLLGGVVAVAFGALLLWQTFMPTTYLYQSPGPALSVVELNGEPVVELTNFDGETYPSETSLLMTTVSTFGNPDESVIGAAAVQALLDNDKNLLPVRAVYGPDVTNDEVRTSSAAMMEASQIDAVLAGYGQAGIEIPVTLTVAGFAEDSYAIGRLEPGDELVALSRSGADRSEPATFRELRDYLAEIEPGTELTVTVMRGGQERETTFATLPSPEGEGSLLGITVMSRPAPGAPGANVSLENVGGPSAGHIFALRIYDLLTEDSIGGDAVVAGTGTVAADGTVGPIGGIEHKLVGARRAGAEYFLAPVSNCTDVVGNGVAGLQVIAVGSLDDSVAALESIKDGETDGLPSCD